MRILIIYQEPNAYTNLTTLGSNEMVVLHTTISNNCYATESWIVIKMIFQSPVGISYLNVKSLASAEYYFILSNFNFLLNSLV